MSPEQAFEEFMRQFQDMVFTTAVRLLGDPTEAEDVAQQVFIKAYEHFEKLSGHPNQAGWLKTVTINLCINHLNRYRRRWRLFSELSTNQKNGESPAQDPSVAVIDAAGLQNLQALERQELVEKLLRRLPAHQRAALILFHLEGLSYQQIAEKLHISVAKVKTDIFRARERLRNWLQSIQKKDKEPGL